jgi:hypothetical protein
MVHQVSNGVTDKNVFLGLWLMRSTQTWVKIHLHKNLVVTTIVLVWRALASTHLVA